MALLNWREDYSVGVATLDDQHKKLFGLINAFHESMKTSTDKVVRDAILTELSEYADNHLKTEESYFEEYNYPKKEEHKKDHDSYREKVKSFMEKEDSTLLSFDVLDYLEDWWLGHITTVDQEYKKFFTKKGLN